MATRGCTSSAASRVAQVRLMSCTVNAVDTRLGAARLETTVQVPRLEWRTGPSRERQPALHPGGACRSLRGGLASLADSQGRHADTRHRHGCLRGLGLSFPVEQLATDPLKLPADIQLAPVQVHRGPGQADHLALAQAHHENQHVRGIERILIPLRRLQELARFLGCPRLPAICCRRLASERTIRDAWTILCSALTNAVTEELIPRNVASLAHVSKPHMRKVKPWRSSDIVSPLGGHPCAQHWQVSLSLLSQPRTSRKVSLSSGAAARRRVRRSPRRALPLSGPPGAPAPHQPAVADQSCYRRPLRLGSAPARNWPQPRQ